MTARAVRVYETAAHTVDDARERNGWERGVKDEEERA